MKKVIIIFLAIVILAIVGITVFIATFDINKYNKALASQIENIVGNPVEIERLSLGWKGKLLLGIENFRILVVNNGQKTPELSFDRGEMSLDLMPLLGRQIKISSISVTRPIIHLIRAKDGVIKIFGYNPKNASGPMAPSKAVNPQVVADFNISSIVIRNGTIRFEDLMAQPPADIIIDNFDADIKNVSFNSPVQFAVKMALFSTKQNAAISGTAGGFSKGAIFVKDMTADIDLGNMDNAKLVKAVPMAGQFGIQKGLGGSLKMKLQDLELEGDKVAKLSGDITLIEGKVPLSQLNVPVEHVGFSAAAENSTLTIKSLSANLANSRLKGSGIINDIFTIPRTSLRATIDVPGIKAFLEAAKGGRQYLDGNMMLSLDGTMSGTGWDEISKTISGTGTFSLDKGIIMDTNIVTQSLSALTLFPTLIDSLGSSASGALKQLLSQQYTLLKPIKQSFTITNGNISIPDLAINSDIASLSGDANLALSGELNGKGIMRFEPALSNAMLSAVPQMSYLAGTDKTISFPVSFRGSTSGFSVLPDLQSITTNAVVQKGEDIATDLLTKARNPKTATQSGQTGSQTEQPLGLGDIFKKAK